MDFLFSTSLAYRQMLVNAIDKMDDEILDIIPDGSKNNIRWHLAHLVVTPGLLTYRLIGRDIPLISIEFINSAKKGTNPDSFSLNEDFGKKHLCELLIETVKQSQRDFEELSKEKFKPYETSTGYVLENLSSAIAFSNIHDGLHIGNIRMMARFIESGS
jgi:hypothetical protein